MMGTQELDLLVMSSSWEVRSTAATARLFPRFSFRKAIVFRYRPEKMNSEAAQREEVNFAFIKSFLERTGIDVTTIVTELRSAEVGLRQLHSALHAMYSRDSNLEILIDVSTFTKAHTLVFLRYLSDPGKRNSVRALFTDIVDPNEGKPSRGLDRVVSLPLFGSAYKQDLESMLFLFIGFEPERIIGLWKMIEPNATVPLFARRRDGKNPLRLKAYENDLLNYPGVMEPIEIPTAPLKAASVLAQLYAECAGKYNLALSATGNKLQCIGLHLSFQWSDASMPIFYPVPDRYEQRYWNPDKYSGVSLLMKISPPRWGRDYRSWRGKCRM